MNNNEKRVLDALLEDKEFARFYDFAVNSNDVAMLKRINRTIKRMAVSVQ